jgi:hypothetical protein
LKEYSVNGFTNDHGRSNRITIFRITLFGRPTIDEGATESGGNGTSLVRAKDRQEKIRGEERVCVERFFAQLLRRNILFIGSSND